MRIVLDANVLISALISQHGASARILEAWENARFDLVVSAPILEELARVLHYPRIQEKYNLPDEYIQGFLGLIVSQAMVVSPCDEINIIAVDPTDNRYLECAVEGMAAYIITGDRHLLDIGDYRGIIILPPAGFLTLLDFGEE